MSVLAKNMIMILILDELMSMSMTFFFRPGNKTIIMTRDFS